MSIIKQLATYDGSAWTKDDIGANASNVSLSSNIAGSNNVQGALSNLCGASKLAGSSAIVTNSSGVLTTSSVTSTELGYLSGATSNLQGQIDTLNNNLFTQIMSGTIDLNDYKSATDHRYYYFGGTVTLVNQPHDAVNGWLEVLPAHDESGVNIQISKQIWHRGGSVAGRSFSDQYIRYYNTDQGWSNWEKILVTAPTILYNNDTNAFDTAVITLNDNALNYAYLKIFFKDNDNFRGSIDVIPVAGRIFPLLIFHTSAARSEAYIKVKSMTINPSNTSQIITTKDSNGNYIYNAQLVWSTNGIIAGNYIAITQVIGYKNF